MSGEIQWPAAVVQALGSLRLKLGRGTSEREAEVAKVLDECISRMSEGESVDPHLDEYPGLRGLLEMMLLAAQ